MNEEEARKTRDNTRKIYEDARKTAYEVYVVYEASKTTHEEAEKTAYEAYRKAEKAQKTYKSYLEMKKKVTKEYDEM